MVATATGDTRIKIPSCAQSRAHGDPAAVKNTVIGFIISAPYSVGRHSTAYGDVRFGPQLSSFCSPRRTSVEVRRFSKAVVTLKWSQQAPDDLLGVGRAAPVLWVCVGATSSDSAWAVRCGPIASNLAFCSSDSVAIEVVERRTHHLDRLQHGVEPFADRGEPRRRRERIAGQARRP